MHLFILENSPSTRLGGQELSLFDVAKGLAKKGHEITFLYAKEGNLLEAYRKFCGRVICVPGGYSLSSKHRFGSAMNFFTSLAQIPKQKHSIVYANQYLDSFFALFLAKFARSAFVCHLRLPPPDFFCTQYRIGLSGAHHLIAVSEHTKSEYASRGFDPKSIDVVHNGIDTDKFCEKGDRQAVRAELGFGPSDFVVTYAGRLHPAKGVQVLFEAFKMIAPNCPNAKLFICGQPGELGELGYFLQDYRKELNEVARLFEITDKIIWLDHSDQMQKIYLASDVVVLPSLWPEPFGRILIEAMACGVPTIGSRTGGIPEILSGDLHRWTFTPGIAEELADRLMSLVHWRADQPALAQTLRQHVLNRFSTQINVGGIEKVLLNVHEKQQQRKLKSVTTRWIR